MGTCIAVENSTLHGFVDLAERGIQAGLNVGLGFIARGGAVGGTGTEATLHQRAHRRLVSLVLKAVALSDLDAFL